ncbi:uncharacterized protein DS421_13g417060 [Arachis hypogaea]|nr:uncharacterized protein DS421_13g417060 [Arachis hypogaea]
MEQSEKEDRRVVPLPVSVAVAVTKAREVEKQNREERERDRRRRSLAHPCRCHALPPPSPLVQPPSSSQQPSPWTPPLSSPKLRRRLASSKDAPPSPLESRAEVEEEAIFPVVVVSNYYSIQNEFIVLFTVVANSRCCCPIKAVVNVANIAG